MNTTPFDKIAHTIRELETESRERKLRNRKPPVAPVSIRVKISKHQGVF